MARRHGTGKQTVTLLDAGDGMIAAIALYSDDFECLIKSIPGSWWNSDAIRWEFPVEEGKAFREVFASWLILSSEAAKTPHSEGRSDSTDESPSLPPSIGKSLYYSLRALKYSRKTSQRYVSIAECYVRFLDVPLEKSSSADITRFLAFLEHNRDSSASTINQAISALRFLYSKVLGKETFLTRRPKADRRLPGILSRDEAMRIVMAPRNIKHRSLLVLAYSAGLRVSEIASLRVDDIDVARGVILVRKGKGRKDRYTILSTKAKSLLDTYLDLYKPQEWLFEGQNGGHLSTRSIQEVFVRAKNKLGITKNVSIHSLRHSFATHLLEDGTDIRYIQELLGHANAKTTQIYTHVARKDFLRIRSPFDRND
jgi:site-specific recombinase XerD